MADVTFEIKQKVAVLSDRGKGWNKEVNLVSWNGGEPKVDIREWNSDHSSMKRGVTFSREEYEIMVKAFKKINAKDICDYRRRDVSKASGVEASAGGGNELLPLAVGQ